MIFGGEKGRNEGQKKFPENGKRRASVKDRSRCTVFSALTILFVLLLAVTLCACGASEENSGGKTPAELSAEEKYAVAEKMVGGSYADLVTRIGEAESSVHSARCGTSGEDYEYTYSGFVVLTYREGDTEQIEAVEKEG